MVGIVFIIIMVGFIEGYLIWYIEMLDIIWGLFIFLCFVFVLLYFVWYFCIKVWIGFNQLVCDICLILDVKFDLLFMKIWFVGELFIDLFVFYKWYFGIFLVGSLVSVFLFIVFVFLLGNVLFEDCFSFLLGIYFGVENIGQFFNNFVVFLIFFVYVLSFFFIGFLVFRKFGQEECFDYRRLFGIVFINFMLFMGVLMALLYINDWYIIFLVVFFVVVFVIWGYCSYWEGCNFLFVFSKSLFLWSFSFSWVFSFLFMLLLVGLLFYFLVNMVLAWFFVDLVIWVVLFDQAGMD